MDNTIGFTISRLEIMKLWIEANLLIYVTKMKSPSGCLSVAHISRKLQKGFR